MKMGDTRPALEDCTLDALHDYNGMILPNSVQLVESELPLSEACNYEELSGVFLFRQIFSPDNTIQCLFCRNEYSLRSPADLEIHYRIIHELAVNASKAEFNENIVFVWVPSDVNEETTLSSGCRYCETTLKSLSEVRDHYPNDHNKTVRLVPYPDVTEIGNFFYCGLCGHPSEEFTSHHHHMKVMHRMQTYVCRYCTYCTARPSHLRTHVKERHIQDQPDLYLRCSECSVYLHAKDRLTSHAVETGRENVADMMDRTAHIDMDQQFEEMQDEESMDSKPIEIIQLSCARCMQPFESENHFQAHICTGQATTDCQGQVVSTEQNVFGQDHQIIVQSSGNETETIDAH